VRKTAAFVLAATLILGPGACAPAGEDDASAGEEGSSAQSRPAEIVLMNALIVDGSGDAGFRGDVGIAGGEVVGVGPSGSVDAIPDAEVIDLEGLALAPGFIDIHNHSDGSILRQPLAEALLSQGLTTIVVGADGGSRWTIGEYLQEIDAAAPALNVGVLVGHGTLRRRIMGDDFKRAFRPASSTTPASTPAPPSSSPCPRSRRPTTASTCRTCATKKRP